jgi:hypothetical protein
MKQSAMKIMYAGILAAATLTGGCLNDVDAIGPTSGTPAGSAPIISGNPASSTSVGNAYSFTPTASDPDGDALTFSIENRPGWATFDTSSGRLAGTPSDVNVGAYQNIVISVSDGALSASLPSFSIAVNQIAMGSATLSWTAPQRNNDGSALMDLAGYTIYYGLSEGNYSNSVRVDNPGITTFVVDNLPPNTYYFAATARNNSGAESALSDAATATVVAN